MNKQFTLLQNIDSTIQCQIQDSQVQISVKGCLQHDSNLSTLSWVLSEVTRRQAQVEVDLSNLNDLTALGAKRWKEAVKTATSTITYKHLKEPVIELANTIPDLLGATYRIQSFEAPFYCTKCKKESYILLSAPESNDISSLVLQQQTCQYCGGVSEFGTFHLTYLRFLRASNQTHRVDPIDHAN